MNIKQAKQQIRNAAQSYFTTDENGAFLIPVERQRPVFMIGPPGIGKTAVMEQIAAELGVGLVSYSMTHHTRQSALGLPFIVRKTYGGKEFSVSEYTMSEIIASVWERIENDGVEKGILFLDEINCVSETLAPSMLQFLQYKTFGTHRVPDGWIVVTAGNPPEYNNSVREFDIVTWDRLKRIDIEPDYKAWKEYAAETLVHPAIRSYLDIRESDFYRVESTVDGKTFVTARGWSDLSDMIRLCEENGDKVDENMIRQYLQNRKIAKDFAVYYDLFNKYRADYQVDRILDGKADEAVKQRAKKARFDERLSLLGLLLDAVTGECHDVYRHERAQSELMAALKAVRGELSLPGANASASLERQRVQRQKTLDSGRRAGILSADEQYALNASIAALEEQKAILVREEPASESVFTLLKSDFDFRTEKLTALADQAGKKLSNVFRFCEAAFPEGQEMVILVTELTRGFYTAGFISHYGCEEYFAHNKELLFYERQKEIISEIESLDLE
jgi:hypothetical protein